jgi:predicted small integral membrane protein
MDTHASLMIFQATCFLGFSLWLSIALINNLHAFSSSVAAVGATMAMAPLRQPPAIDFPLLARALSSPALHRLALIVVVLLQVAAVLAAWTGCYELLLDDGLDAARPWLNLALSAALAFLFAMLLGGLWFGYWIRQEGLQLTHLVLVVWVLLNFLVLNLRWS